ncbi:uncharacterized protein [Chelonus insularis]|uniref:uncharacterized protein isoform X2 n=1 Tax=Chelonus insularis TaxID=460826 RepID=UPI00158C7FFF|nr:uncharacterized protein LOC118071842 isoform X2 [Chelonus insularis]
MSFRRQTYFLICVGKLKDDPNNADILAQIQEIQLHIVSLGRCQKQVVQRLRKEVEAFKAENANGAKLSVASLLGLNNNNHITPGNEQRDEVVQVKVQTNGISESRRSSKDDYEEVVHNGDVSVTRDICAKERSISVETVSIDEEIIELSNDESSREKHEDTEDIDSRECSAFEECKTVSKQIKFLDNLGLITVSKFDKLQNKKAERKRRSTANPQFVYSNWDIPTKKKKYSYLQSAGNGPQTRQTTRLNGPSPPPPSKCTSKSTSPPIKTTPKSLMLVQKSLAKPAILKNIPESRLISNKTQAENGVNQTSISNFKSSETKAANIPTLSSDSTVEKIEKIEKTENLEKVKNESVCIHCRSPGNLTICDNCSSSYHTFCHSTVSPPPSRLCPLCAQKKLEEIEEEKPIAVVKKNDELPPESVASGIAGQTGEDSEVNKATGGFYKIDATTPKFNVSFNQFPSSTYLIPIASNPIVPTTTITAPEQTIISTPITFTNQFISPVNNSITYPPFIINQFPPQPCITPFIQSEPRISFNYSLPVINTQPEKQQYLIVKKISDPCVGGIVSFSNQQQVQPTLSYKLPSITQESGVVESKEGQSNFIDGSTFFYDQLAGCQSEPAIRNNGKSTTREIPGLNRITTVEKSENVVGNLEPSSPSPTSVDERKQRKSDIRARAKSTEVRLSINDNLESTAKLEASEQFKVSSSPKPETGSLNSLFSSDQKSDFITSSVDKSQQKDFSDLKCGSISNRLFRRIVKDQSSLRTGQSTSEYLKLEEAHLSAPSSTNLVNTVDIVCKSDTLIRSRSCPSVEIINKENDPKQTQKSFIRRKRRSLDSLPYENQTNMKLGERRKKYSRESSEKDTDDEMREDSMSFEANILEDTLTADEGESEISDTPDDIDNERIASSIDMQVLEDFETAMREAETSDTANIK